MFRKFALAHRCDTYVLHKGQRGVGACLLTCVEDQQVPFLLSWLQQHLVWASMHLLLTSMHLLLTSMHLLLTSMHLLLTSSAALRSSSMQQDALLPSACQWQHRCGRLG
jgi:hypothetical protein